MIKYFVNDSPRVLFVVLFFIFVSWFARAVQSLTRLLFFYLLIHYLYISAWANVTSSITLAAPMQEEYCLCQKTHLELSHAREGDSIKQLLNGIKQS